MADKQADIPACPKRVCVLGPPVPTEQQTLDVARRHPEFVKIVALSANTQAELLLEQAREFSVEHVVLANAEIADAWRARFAEVSVPRSTQVLRLSLSCATFPRSIWW